MLHHMHFDHSINGSFLQLEKPPLRSPWAVPCKRWAPTLTAYSYRIHYEPGKDHANANVPSWLPFPKNIPQPSETILLMETLVMTPVSSEQVKQWIDKPILSKVQTKAEGKRSPDVHPLIQPYLKRMDKLGIQDGYVLWGNRVDIP